MSGEIGVFKKALENLRDQPAAYTILVLMILLGYLNNFQFTNEDLKFWIIIATYPIIALTLVLVVFLPTFPKTPKHTNQGEGLSDTVSFSKLIDTKLVNVRVKYDIEFKEVSKEGLWLKLRLLQETRNNSLKRVERVFRINYYSRERRKEVIKRNSDLCDLSGFAEYRTEKGLAMEYSIPANDSYTIEYSAEILYNRLDSDFFLTFLPAKKFEIRIKNNLESGDGQVEYVIDKQYLSVNNDGTVGENNEKTIILNEGVLPYNGIALKWKTK